jgi:gamma-glutamylcyclotransferase (GGCT)/AIG2-like uncharacterized protein YtfP
VIDRLFVYGTLEIPDVLHAVTGRDFPSRPALLEDYDRALLRGEVYPAIVMAPGRSTPGTLYSGVDAGAFERLDRFEGDPFERIEVKVGILSRPQDTSELLRAFVYVLAPSRRDLLSGQPWDRARFEREHLGDFLRSVGPRLARDVPDPG